MYTPLSPLSQMLSTHKHKASLGTHMLTSSTHLKHSVLCLCSCITHLSIYTTPQTEYTHKCSQLLVLCRSTGLPVHGTTAVQCPRHARPEKSLSLSPGPQHPHHTCARRMPTTHASLTPGTQHVTHTHKHAHAHACTHTHTLNCKCTYTYIHMHTG